MTELSEIGQAVPAAAASRRGRVIVVPAGGDQHPVELPEAVSEMVELLLHRDIQQARQRAATDQLANEAQELGMY
jgi:hypothetical protein